LRNASAAADTARQITGDRAVQVIRAGERWPDGSLRPAIEDLFNALIIGRSPSPGMTLRDFGAENDDHRINITR